MLRFVGLLVITILVLAVSPPQTVGDQNLNMVITKANLNAALLSRPPNASQDGMFGAGKTIAVGTSIAHEKTAMVDSQTITTGNIESQMMAEAIMAVAKSESLTDLMASMTALHARAAPSRLVVVSVNSMSEIST